MEDRQEIEGLVSSFWVPRNGAERRKRNTARLLGIEVPPGLLSIADEVIE